jgi:hypothetical protein
MPSVMSIETEIAAPCPAPATLMRMIPGVM